MLLLGGSRPELRTVLVLTIRQEAFLHFQEACSVFLRLAVPIQLNKSLIQSEMVFYFSELRTALIVLVTISSGESLCVLLSHFPLLLL